ncbi:MAG: class I SAM-dependent methyltransferase [Nanoarchaeota archaeon]|nr:class I SAM-dependent methyltransferase [Nanoarchaeota archaeon]MBU1946841.1 class I SAM-dependent methyltransferase [Nanoarchaeota archaeon]
MSLSDEITFNTPDEFLKFRKYRAPFCRVVKKAVSRIASRIVDLSCSKLEFGAGDGQAIADFPNEFIDNLLLLEPMPEAVELGRRLHNVPYVLGEVSELDELFPGRNFGLIYGKDIDAIPQVEVVAQKAYAFLQPGGVFFHYKDMLPHYEAIALRLKTDRNQVLFATDENGILESFFIVEYAGRVLNAYLRDLMDGGSELRMMTAMGEASVTKQNCMSYVISSYSKALKEAGFRKVKTFYLHDQYVGGRTDAHQEQYNYFLTNLGQLSVGDLDKGEKGQLGDGVRTLGDKVMEECYIPMTIAWK